MPGVLKAAPAAPLARRQRRALPWEARPAHAGPHPRDARSARLTRHADRCSGTAVFLAADCPAHGPGLRLARTLKLPPWRRPGDPLVLVKRSQGRLKPVRPAKPLKPRRDLGVIQVRMIAAAGADRPRTCRCSRPRHGRPRCGPAGSAGPPRCRGRADRRAGMPRPSGTMRSHGSRRSRGCGRRRWPDGQPVRYPSQGQRRQDCSLNSPPGSRSCHYRGLEQRRCYPQTVHAGRPKDAASRAG